MFSEKNPLMLVGVGGVADMLIDVHRKEHLASGELPLFLVDKNEMSRHPDYPSSVVDILAPGIEIHSENSDWEPNEQSPLVDLLRKVDPGGIIFYPFAPVGDESVRLDEYGNVHPVYYHEHATDWYNRSLQQNPLLTYQMLEAVKYVYDTQNEGERKDLHFMQVSSGSFHQAGPYALSKREQVALTEGACYRYHRDHPNLHIFGKVVEYWRPLPVVEWDKLESAGKGQTQFTHADDVGRFTLAFMKGSNELVYDENDPHVAFATYALTANDPSLPFFSRVGKEKFGAPNHRFTRYEV
jgi:hypothetical protein|tara:strand:- start:568 stop:1458 length:891 start_codon:yes stop_codon:yes gene_type:complete